MKLENMRIKSIFFQTPTQFMNLGIPIFKKIQIFIGN